MVKLGLSQSAPEVRAALITAAGDVYARAFAAADAQTVDDAGHAAEVAYIAMESFLDKLEACSK